MTKEEIKQFIAIASDPQVKQLAEAELQKYELQEAASQGDELSVALLALKDAVDAFQGTNPQTTGATVSKDEVEKMLQDALKKTKISYDDLNAELRAKLAGQVKVQLNLSTPYSAGLVSSQTLMNQFEDPLFQKLLSDFLARNNVYLFGGAGTGKTFIANEVANFLGYRYIEVNCNQFTSPLDLVGGQTITGYQKGRLEMAWTNVDETGQEFKGAVLCLDELPKLDPNTAGVLNAALAKLKNFKKEPNGTIKGPTILNGRGESIELKNMFVIATGNTRLNETSVEYEANFKQDLSLQDRFIGSCYEVVANYKNEFNDVMKGLAFIWIYMTKLREQIVELRLTGQAFVSYRIMIAMKDTYLVYRDIENLKVKEQTLSNPKTLKQSLDSFLNLFKPEQMVLLQQKTDYNEFIRIIEKKNKLPLDKLDTQEELDEAQRMIAAHEALMKQKIS